MAVIANLNLLAAHCHHAFDVELVLAKCGNAPGFKDDDLSALGCPEIVSNAVDEKVIASHDFKFDDLLALLEGLADVDAGSLLERRPATIRRGADGVGCGAHDA